MSNAGYDSDDALDLIADMFARVIKAAAVRGYERGMRDGAGDPDQAEAQSFMIEKLASLCQQAHGLFLSGGTDSDGSWQRASDLWVRDWEKTLDQLAGRYEPEDDEPTVEEEPKPATPWLDRDNT